MCYLFGDVQPGLGTGLFSVWLIGGALALFSWRLSWIASIAAIAAGTVVLGRIASGAEYSLLAYAGLLLILVSLLMLPPTISASSSAGQAVTIIAGYSFTLYLTHYTILYHLHSIWPDGGWHLALTGIALSNVVALAMAWPTEMRHRALARWLMKFDPFAKPKRLWQAPGPTG
jgi:peptidoglycan/LPS O-acetylase OafA/YrhL